MDAPSSHIQKLPVELLTEIFILSSGQNELTAKVENVPGITLSLVQRKWCDIAQQTPSLWSSIFIDLDCCWGNDAKVQRWAHLLDLLMQRSRSTLLTLYLINIDIDYLNDSGDMLLVLKPLIDHCQRWESLHMIVNDLLLRHTIFLQSRGALMSLRFLSITYNRWSMDIDQPLSLFEDCPALQYFDCRGVVLPEVTVPWGQLTYIVYTMPIAEALARVLPHCHCLKGLCLDELCEEQEDLVFQVQRRVLTPEMRCLRLLAPTNSAQILQYLDMIQARCLDTFEIEGFVSEPNHHHPHDFVIAQLIPHIDTFLTTSSCSIQWLSLKNVPFTDVELISVLWLMPTVDELIIHEVDVSQRKPADGRRNNIVTKRFLDHLRYRSDADSNSDRPTEPIDSSIVAPHSKVLLPQLTGLELRVFDEELDDDWCDALVQAVISRWLPDSDDTETTTGGEADIDDTTGGVASCACWESLGLFTMEWNPFSRMEAFGRLIALADKEDGFELVFVDSDIE